MERISLDFMNTSFNDLRAKRQIDRLDDTDWRRDFTKRWELKFSASVSGSTLDALKELRSIMWRITETLTENKSPSKQNLKRLNEFISSSEFKGRVFFHETKFEFDLIPSKRDWNWIMAEITMDFAQLLSDYDWHRVRICGNDDCRFAFYDASKSGGKLYCRDACSLLARVHRFRRKQNPRKKKRQ